MMVVEEVEMVEVVVEVVVVVVVVVVQETWPLVAVMVAFVRPRILLGPHVRWNSIACVLIFHTLIRQSI
jgi:hypothetical protein